MARKTAADFSDDPVVRAKAMFDKANAEKEEHWNLSKTFVSADGSWARGVTRDKLAAWDRKWDQILLTTFQTHDAWLRAQRKASEPPAPVLVEVEDVRAVVIVSLEDKMDELAFSVNRGLLGSKIANAIISEVAEGDVGEAPFCEDCQDG